MFRPWVASRPREANRARSAGMEVQAMKTAKKRNPSSHKGTKNVAFGWGSPGSNAAFVMLWRPAPSREGGRFGALKQRPVFADAK
jgi:hypothetical protein